MAPRRIVVLLSAAAVVVVTLGGILASNQGFQIVYLMQAAQPGVSRSGTHTLSLPYRPKPGLEMASDLFRDLGPHAQRVERYLTAADTYQTYTFGSPDFALVPGEGYRVKIGQDLAYPLLGSHDRDLAVTLLGPENPNSLSGVQLISIPYHARAKTARDLFREIGATNLQNIQRFDTTTDEVVPYAFGKPDFPLVKGQAYFVKVTRDVTYLPAHY